MLLRRSMLTHQTLRVCQRYELRSVSYINRNSSLTHRWLAHYRDADLNSAIWARCLAIKCTWMPATFCVAIFCAEPFEAFFCDRLYWWIPHVCDQSIIRTNAVRPTTSNELDTTTHVTSRSIIHEGTAIMVRSLILRQRKFDTLNLSP